MKIKYTLHKAIANFEFEEIELETEVNLEADLQKEIVKLQLAGWSSTAEYRNKKGFPVLPLAGLTDENGKKI